MTINLFSAGTCRAPAWFMNRSATFRTITVPVGVALIDHPKAGLILFDTGLHPRCLTISHWSQILAHQLIHFDTTPENTVVRWLADRAIKPSDIRYIILSHYHNDHMGGLLDFPEAQFIAHRAEFHRLKAMNTFQQSSAAFNRALIPADFEQRLLAIDDLPTAERSDLPEFVVVKEVVEGLFLVDLPGHTRVQYGAYVPSLSLFLVADALWTEQGLDGPATEPPSIVRLIKDNWTNYKETIKRLRQLRARQPRLRILASHDRKAFGISG